MIFTDARLSTNDTIVYINKLIELEVIKGVDNVTNNFIPENERIYTVENYIIPITKQVNKVKINAQNGRLKIATIKNSDEIQCKIKYMNKYKNATVIPIIDEDVFHLKYNESDK